MAAWNAPTFIRSPRIRGWLGQLVPLVSAAALFGLSISAAPLFGHSAYLLALPVLLVCALLGGAPSVLTGVLAFAVVGFVVDLPSDLAALERYVRLAVFLGAGLGTAALLRRSAARDAAPRGGQPDGQGEQLSIRLASAWNDSAINEMASVLSHELNQPLAAIANYLRAARALIAREELKDDALLLAVTRAGDQSIRAGHIVRTMRELTTKGGTQLRLESLSDILRELQVILTPLAREHGVKISYGLYEGIDTLQADRIQIQQLVVNLARNALQAMADMPNRKLKINTILNGETELILSVEDSGPGIDLGVMARPFLPLSSTSPDRMGLGLAICSGIVHNHRGRIWVESAPEGGAAFRVGLPRAGGHGGANGRKSGLRRR